MRVEICDDRARIEAWLRREPETHVYPLADLDDFFWPQTTWYVARDDGGIRALGLVLDTLGIPVLYALGAPGDPDLRALLLEIRDLLPSRFFVNLSPGLGDVFSGDWDFAPQGEHQKMVLAEPVDRNARHPVEELAPADLEELQGFYARDAYTLAEAGGRFFEPYMLEFGPYLGIREGGRLVAAGGVHVHSRERRVAAIGNVATSPSARGKGHGSAITHALCSRLQASVDHIGLNVETRNATAIRCYERLGFRAVCRYAEGIYTRR